MVVADVGEGARRTGLAALLPVREGDVARAWDWDWDWDWVGEVLGVGLLGREPRGVPLAELPSLRRSLKPVRPWSVAAVPPSESEPAPPPIAVSLRLSWSPAAAVRDGWREYESTSARTDVSEGFWEKGGMVERLCEGGRELVLVLVPVCLAVPASTTKRTEFWTWGCIPLGSDV